MLAVSLAHSRHSEEMCGIDEFYLPFVSLMQLLTQAWRNQIIDLDHKNSHGKIYFQIFFFHGVAMCVCCWGGVWESG